MSEDQKYKLWSVSEEEKKKQVQDQPEGTMFYLFSLKWTNPLDGKKRRFDTFVKIWWGKNFSVYTYDLNDAGQYTKEQALSVCSDGCFPLPVAMVEAGEFGKVMKSIFN